MLQDADSLTILKSVVICRNNLNNMFLPGFCSIIPSKSEQRNQEACISAHSGQILCVSDSFIESVQSENRNNNNNNNNNNDKPDPSCHIPLADLISNPFPYTMFVLNSFKGSDNFKSYIYLLKTKSNVSLIWQNQQVAY